jgi:hypothetical protein
MHVLLPHIRDVLKNAAVDEELSNENALAQAIANAIAEVQLRAYTKGMPARPPLVMPRNDTVPSTTVLGAPRRERQSLLGQRVAAIEGRHSTPGAIRSCRLHGVATHSLCLPTGKRTNIPECVSQTMLSISQQL